MDFNSFLGPLNLGFQALSAILWKGLEGPTKFLRSDTESLGLLDVIFGQAWGIGGKISTYVLFGIIAVLILGRMKLVENLPYALLGVALTSALGGAVIWNIHHDLLQIGPATVHAIVPAETLTPENISKPFFPPAEDGLPAVGLYLLYWAITLLFLVMKGVAWVGRDIVPGILLVAVAVWAFTGVGRSFLRWLLMFYACCILLMDTVVAFVAAGSYNVMQNLKREDMRMVAVIALIAVVGILFWAFLACYKMITTSSAGGWLRSRVKGHTKSDVENEPKVQTRDQDVTVVATVVSAETTPGSTDRVAGSGSQDSSVHITDSKLVSGGITLGTQSSGTQATPDGDPQKNIERSRPDAGRAA